MALSQTCLHVVCDDRGLIADKLCMIDICILWNAYWVSILDFQNPKTRSPAVAGMGRRFREVDLTVSIGLIEETESLNFALILVIADIMVG